MLLPLVLGAIADHDDGQHDAAALDFADMFGVSRARSHETRLRFVRTIGVIAAFACGCAIGALLYARAGRYGLLIAPAMGIGAFVVALRSPPSG
jgi:uncharacterized membrane protein YoaK (UPF0700 family)